MIDSILTVTAAAETYDLTTIERVKRELGITDGGSDTLLTDWVREESANFADLTARVFASETVQEVFRLAWSPRRRAHPAHAEHLALARYPVSQLLSVTEADATDPLDATLYELDPKEGLLYRLDLSGRRQAWFSRTVTVAYTGGYQLLDELPRKIETAVVTLVRNRWFAAKRDPALKSENIPGVIQRDFWVGAIGNGLPIDVQQAIDLYRSVRV